MDDQTSPNPSYLGGEKGNHLFLLVVIVECGTYGRTILRIFRNVEADVVELLQSGEYLLALGQQREVAYQYEVADIAA